MTRELTQNELQILRTIDKKDRIGISGVKELLAADPDKNPAGCGLSGYKLEVWSQFLDLPSGQELSNKETLLQLQKFFEKLALVDAICKSGKADEFIEAVG